MKRLLHVIDDLDPGGAQTQLGLLARAAAERGEPVAVATLRRPGHAAATLIEAGIDVVWLGRRHWCDPIAALRLDRLTRSWRADALQSWDAASAAFCRVVRRRQSRTAWVDTVRHASEARRTRADRVIATDESAADAARRAGVDAGRIDVVPNAIEASAVATLDRLKARQGLRTAGVDVADDAPVIALIARHDDARTTNELVWASDLVRIVRPGLRMLIAGEGRSRLACERFASEATEPGTVQWLGRWVDVTPVLAAADLVWCGGGAPAATPILAALSAGRPVIAPSCELAGNQSLGTRVPLGDRAAWARASDRALADRANAADDKASLAGHDLEVVAGAHSAAIGAA